MIGSINVRKEPINWLLALVSYYYKIIACIWTLGQSGNVGEPGRFAYFETEAHPGTVVELSETNGLKGAMFKRIAAAAREWDGSDAIRTEWPL